jgi:hypothetical protein
MAGMESWESAVPQKWLHTSGNITAAEEGEIAGNLIYNRATYTKIRETFPC